MPPPHCGRPRRLWPVKLPPPDTKVSDYQLSRLYNGSDGPDTKVFGPICTIAEDAAPDPLHAEAALSSRSPTTVLYSDEVFNIDWEWDSNGNVVRETSEEVWGLRRGAELEWRSWWSSAEWWSWRSWNDHGFE